MQNYAFFFKITSIKDFDGEIINQCLSANFVLTCKFQNTLSYYSFQTEGVQNIVNKSKSKSKLSNSHQHKKKKKKKEKESSRRKSSKSKKSKSKKSKKKHQRSESKSDSESCLLM